MSAPALGSRAAQGIRWAGLSALLGQAIQAAQLIVLGRLLDPSDFGIMAMATVAAGLAALPAESGIGAALIQRKEVTREAFSSLYWLGLVVGAVMYAALALGAPLVAAGYREPRLLPILGWVCLPLVIAPLGQPFQWMLEKDLEFDRLAWIEIGAAVTEAVASIGGALAGWGIHALVAGTLTGAGVKTAALVALGGPRWKPQLRFESAEVRSYLGFGVNYFGQRTVNFVAANVDTLMVGSVLGATPLGYYYLASNLATVIAGRVNSVVARVLFPVLSLIQEQVAEVRRLYLRMHQFATAVTFPIQFGIAVTAPLFVPLFYGPAWAPSASLLQILALGGIARAAAGTVGPLILSLGRTDLGFRWSLLILGLQIGGIGLAARTGSIDTLAMTVAGLMGLYLLLTYAILVRTLVGPCLGAYLRSMSTSFVLAGLMAVVVFGLSKGDAGFSRPVRLALEVGTGVLVYALLAAGFAREWLGKSRRVFS